MIFPTFNFFGIEAKFHHIGIAVHSIKDVSPESKIFIDNTQNVSVAFVSLNGVNVELIEPLNEASPINQSLKKGVKIVHICYEVVDIEQTLEECRTHGFHCIAKPVPATAFEDRRIGWVYSRQYGLIELVEKAKDK